MTPPRDPRPMTPPDPLEITDEEYRAAEDEQAAALDDFQKLALVALMCPGFYAYQEPVSAAERLKKAKAAWKDAQRRAAADHQTLMRDDPAYRREVREREWD